MAASTREGSHGSTVSPQDNMKRRKLMQRLIMYTARAFYDTKSVIVLDQLSRNEVLKDDDLAGRVGLSSKDLSKITAILIRHGLLQVYRQNTSRTGETQSRVIHKGYYYIDHAKFCNMLKWRMSEMHRKIDSLQRNELAQQGYVCPQCSKKFQTLDIGSLAFGLNGFICDDCGAELVDNSYKNQEGREDQMQRFNAQTRMIREGLKKTEDMVMPSVDIHDWIKKHPPIGPAADSTNEKGDDGLAIAGANGSAAAPQVYEIVFATDDSHERERIEREREASLKRKQNALPAWHTRSTVTGQVTAFGLANAQYEDESHINANLELDNPDVKPDLRHEDTKNSIDMYYANLEYTESRMSLASTPNNDDEDSKALKHQPSHSYLLPGAGTPGSAKRKREYEDDGSDEEQTLPGSGSISQADPGQTLANGYAGVNGSGGVNSDLGNMVLVNGQEVPLSAVTEEHLDQMTPDEYEQYFEVLGRTGG